MSKTLDFSVDRTESSELTLLKAKVKTLGRARATSPSTVVISEKANLMISRGKACNEKKLAPARRQPTSRQRRRRDPRQLRRQVDLRDQGPGLRVEDLDDAAGRPPR